MPVTTVHTQSSTPGHRFSFTRVGPTGLPPKAERLLALGDNYRPNLKRASIEQNRLGALLEAREELKQTLARPVHTEMLNTQDWVVDDLFPNADALLHDPALTNGAVSRRRSADLLTNVPSSQAHDTYYDSTQVPLHVSQQTSASAMRDIGLHKRAPLLNAPGNESPVQRNHKFTLKKHTNDQGYKKHRPRNAYGDEDVSRKGAITNFFSSHRAQSPATLLSLPMLTRAAPVFPPRSESPFSPEDIKSHHPDRPLDTFKAMIPVNPSRPLTRLDDDGLQGVKKHIRKPPKGIRNWFDGFDVSSDEDQVDTEPSEVWALKASPQNLSKKQVVPNTAPEDLVASRRHPAPWNDETSSHSREPPSDVHSGSTPSKSSHKRVSRHPSSHQRLPDSRGPSESAENRRSSVPFDDDSNKPPVRPTPSRLASASVLSLSSSEAENCIGSDPESGYNHDGTIVLGKAAPVDLQKVRPRQLTHQPGDQRDPVVGRKNSACTQQTSSSLTARVSSDVSHSPDMRASLTARKMSRAMRTDVASAKPHDRNVSSSRYSATSPHYDTVSGDRPIDGPRMMEVTEEEMVLLELMRNKRAKRVAMQKQSFTEGYQAALGQKPERQLRRQSSGQSEELKFHPHTEGRRESHHRSSPTEDEDTVSARRRYSLLKMEDVDRDMNIRRFLAQEPSMSQALYHEDGTNSSEHEVEEEAWSSNEMRVVPEPTRRVGLGASGEQRVEISHDRFGQSFASSSAPELVKSKPTLFVNRQTRAGNGRLRVPTASPGAEDYEDQWVPAIPVRNPNRPSPSSSPSPFESGPEHDMFDNAVPPTPIEDVRQSYCPSLPASAPLSLPILSAPTFEHELDDDQTSDTGSLPRDSPRVVIASTFSSHQRPAIQITTGRSFTSPPSTRFSNEIEHAMPLHSSGQSPQWVTQHAIRTSGLHPRDSVSDRSEAITPDTEISRSFSATLSRFQPANNISSSNGTVSPISIPRPLVPSLSKNTRFAAQAPASVAPNTPAQERYKAKSGNRASMMSMTSAGEDVLAAWAELGGGTLNNRG